MEKVLISGSNGYLGKVVFDLLHSQGYNPEPLQIRLEEIPPQSLDYPCIIHCAGALRHRVNDLYASNILGTTSLLEGIINTDCKIIYISSRAVYAQSDLPITEDSALGPSDDEYGKSKLEGERIISQSIFPYLILRPSNIYGLGVRNMGIGFPTKALLKFVNREPVTLHDPDRPQDFFYVWDLASLVLRALKEPMLPNKVINVASDPSSLHGFIRLLAEIFTKKSQIKTSLEVIPGPPPRNAIIDNTLLKNAFPDFSFSSPESVFNRMVDYILIIKGGI